MELCILTLGGLAGSVAAGIGGGVGSLFTEGSFGAGFVGAEAAVASAAASSSFTSGAVSGGVSGFVGGYTADFGNQLMAGENINDAASSALIAGNIGGLMGSAMSGLWNGQEAAQNNRNFWSGEKVDVYLYEGYPVRISAIHSGEDRPENQRIANVLNETPNDNIPSQRYIIVGDDYSASTLQVTSWPVGADNATVTVNINNGERIFNIGLGNISNIQNISGAKTINLSLNGSSHNNSAGISVIIKGWRARW